MTETLLLAALRRVEGRGAIETAHRIRQRASYIFAHAAAAGLRSGDPAQVIKPLMKPKPKSTKQPALIKLTEVRQLIVDVEAERASPLTKLANRLIALTVVRSAVQRHCRWTELEDLDGEEPLWRVPPATMKLILALKDDESYEHLVPLSRQAVEVVKAVQVLTGDLEFLFPNDRYYHRPMSENGVCALIIRANGGIYKGQHCPHGWRTCFSTLMNLWRRKHGRPDDREIIDLMLAHAQDDKTEGAYNRAAHNHITDQRGCAVEAIFIFAKLSLGYDLAVFQCDALDPVAHDDRITVPRVNSIRPELRPKMGRSRRSARGHRPRRLCALLSNVLVIG